MRRHVKPQTPQEMEPLTLNSAKAVKGLFPQDETQENDGLTGAQLFDNTGAARPALTYGDIILLPGHIDFGVDDVATKTKLSRNIELHVPCIVSRPQARGGYLHDRRAQSYELDAPRRASRDQTRSRSARARRS